VACKKALVEWALSDNGAQAGKPMVAVIELAGYAIAGGALAQAVTEGVGAVRRRVREARWDAAEANLFARRAQELLRAVRAQRAKSELTWTGIRKFTIAHKVPEAENICSFYLTPHDQKALPPFEPGQYLTFQLHIPGQPKTVIRCYSLSDAPTRLDHYRVTIKKLPPPPDKPDAGPGLSSSYFHDQLQEGDTLDVRAPNGHFYLDRAHSTPVVLIAGGIGMTPMMSMLTTICDSGGDREVWFFYGLRHGGEHAMKEQLEQRHRDHPNFRLVVVYGQPRPEDRLGIDYDREGHVSVDLMREYLPSPTYQFYICGPPPMMQAVTADLEAWGVPDSRVHYEAFGPATVKKKTAPAEAANEEQSSGVTVSFARSGKDIAWTPDHGAILDAAEANDVPIDFGCRAGNCGTCLTAIKEGKVSYLSEPGAPIEDGSCLTCIAIPKERLVLDA